MYSPYTYYNLSIKDYWTIQFFNVATQLSDNINKTTNGLLESGVVCDRNSSFLQFCANKALLIELAKGHVCAGCMISCTTSAFIFPGSFTLFHFMFFNCTKFKQTTAALCCNIHRLGLSLS